LNTSYLLDYTEPSMAFPLRPLDGSPQASATSTQQLLVSAPPNLQPRCTVSKCSCVAAAIFLTIAVIATIIGSVNISQPTKTRDIPLVVAGLMALTGAVFSYVSCRFRDP
jgi:hypothetical protein